MFRVSLFDYVIVELCQRRDSLSFLEKFALPPSERHCVST